MSTPLMDMLLIITSMCLHPGPLLTQPECVKRMSLCVEHEAFSLTPANIEDAYLQCLKEEKWKQ